MRRVTPEGREGLVVRGVGAAIGVVALETALAWLALGRERASDVVMVYLLGVVVVAMRFGRVPSLLAAMLGVAAYDFFFTTPYFSFAIDDAHAVFTCAALFVVAFVISDLTERSRRSAAEAHRADLAAQSERLRTALLSSVSHDLRTPLAVIKGAATALLEEGAALTAERRRAYLEDVSSEASRLDRLVRNLLAMTALEAGGMRPRKEWQPLDEVIGVALARLDDRLAGRRVEVDLPADLPLVPIDAPLIEQVLVNLLENAAKHTARGAPITIRARAVTAGAEDAVAVEVADTGPLPESLALCRGIVTVHGGTITSERRPDGGASFTFTLPRDLDPPPRGLDLAPLAT